MESSSLDARIAFAAARVRGLARYSRELIDAGDLDAAAVAIQMLAQERVAYDKLEQSRAALR